MRHAPLTHPRPNPNPNPNVRIDSLPTHRLMEELEVAERQTPGLWVCGNYRSGVAFPDCVTFGYDQAKAVQEYLSNEPESPAQGTPAAEAVPA